MTNQVVLQDRFCRKWALFIASFVVSVVAPAWAKKAPKGDLFEGKTLLNLTLKYDISRLQAEKENLRENGLAGEVHVDSRVIPVKVMPRGAGSFHCKQPQLKIDFSDSNTLGSSFEGFGKLKLFTTGICLENITNSISDQQILSNYLIYKLQEQIFPMSYKTRLLSISYEDASGKIRPYRQLAFFMEPEKAIEKRLKIKRIEGWQQIDAFVKDRLQMLDKNSEELMHSFQLYIGNLDYGIPGVYSYILQNAYPIEKNMHIYENKEGVVFPLAYDFDFSRFIFFPSAQGYCNFAFPFFRIGKKSSANCDISALVPLYTSDLQEFRTKEAFIKYYPQLKAALGRWQESEKDLLAKLGPEYLANLNQFSKAMDEVVANTKF